MANKPVMGMYVCPLQKECPCSVERECKSFLHPLPKEIHGKEVKDKAYHSDCFIWKLKKEDL